MIYRITQFVDDKGRTIFARTATVDGIESVTFETGGALTFLDNGQPAEYPFQFKIPGATIEEAFANADEAFVQARSEAEVRLKAEIEAHKRQQLQQILTAPPGTQIHLAN